MRFAERRAASTGEYWERRARFLGERAVLNASHSAAEIPQVTAQQKEELYPILKEALNGQQRVVLDFGCGTGRFTSDLGGMVGGKAIGIDPTASLLELAPASENAEYRLMREGTIPLADGTVDVVWIVLVLGAITDQSALEHTLGEIDRVLAPGAIVFVAENTSDKADGPHWAYRSVDDYLQMFPRYSLVPKGEYVDLDDHISVLVGEPESRGHG